MMPIRRWFGTLAVVINGNNYSRGPMLDFEAVSCAGCMTPDQARALARCLNRVADAIELEAKEGKDE